MKNCFRVILLFCLAFFVHSCASSPAPQAALVPETAPTPVQEPAAEPATEPVVETAETEPEPAPVMIDPLDVLRGAAVEAKENAEKEKSAADKQKASKSAAETYAAASEKLNGADNIIAKEEAGEDDYKEAIALYNDAAKDYAEAARLAALRYAEAEAALLAARKKIADSSAEAMNTENVLLEK